ncbi:MAG: hypothetical protein HY238_15020 [Acidobacteria bacterium]|nr:hypothetical protein [Acidobacteriota bacterium]
MAHLRNFGLPGFTTGSSCVAPRLSNEILAHCQGGEWEAAEDLQGALLPLEDLRDAWGPARVLHAATDLAGLAATGPIPPFVSRLSAAQLDQFAPVVCALAERNAAPRTEAAVVA